MKLRSPKAIRFALAIVGLTALVLVLVPHEPWYDWHRLSYWVDRVDGPGADQERAKEAIREIGPKAIPFLFKKIRSTETQRRRGSVWFKLSPGLQSFFGPDPSIYDKITYALNLLGPSAIPSLRAALQYPSSEVQVAALNAITMMGPKADTTLPALVQLLNQTSAELRVRVTVAIGELGTARTQAIPALTAALVTALRDSNTETIGSRVSVCQAVARVLGRMGPDAKSAIPALTILLDDPKLYSRQEAAIALWQINHDTNLVSRLIRELEQAPDAGEYRTRLQVLAALGPAAQPAVPVILRVMTNFSTDLSHPVREALLKINPEAAAKLDPTRAP
jgi:HEAT repeats